MGPPSFLHGYAPPARERFVSIVRGDGAGVFDDRGRRYVDGLASLWYCQVGHGRGEIAEAVTRQMATLEAFQTFDVFTNEPADALCERLASLAPMPSARVFLTCSGSEAVDTALKLARVRSSVMGQPERTTVVSRRHAYHGVTYGGLSVQGLPPNQAGFGPLLPGVVNVDHDSLDEVASVFAAQGDRIAAVIAEPVLGAGGVFPPEPGYLEGLRELCSAHGALLVLDEVICGFGRLGAWWGAQHYGVEPDMVAFAKGVSSGYQPVGGVLVGRAVRDVLEGDPSFVLRHGHTYSGHPTACAAALANLDLLAGPELFAGAARIAASFGPGLGSLVDEGLLSSARGVGGMWGAGMPDGVAAPLVRDALLEGGVIARPIADHTIAFCPPLVIDEPDLTQCISALRDSLVAVAAGS